MPVISPTTLHRLRRGGITPDHRRQRRRRECARGSCAATSQSMQRPSAIRPSRGSAAIAGNSLPRPATTRRQITTSASFAYARSAATSAAPLTTSRPERNHLDPEQPRVRERRPVGHRHQDAAERHDRQRRHDDDDASPCSAVKRGTTAIVGPCRAPSRARRRSIASAVPPPTIKRAEMRVTNHQRDHLVVAVVDRPPRRHAPHPARMPMAPYRVNSM